MLCWLHSAPLAVRILFHPVQYWGGVLEEYLICLNSPRGRLSSVQWFWRGKIFKGKVFNGDKEVTIHEKECFDDEYVGGNACA